MRFDLSATDPRWRFGTGRLVDNRLSIEAGDTGYAISGPYIAFPAGRACATIFFVGPISSGEPILVDVVCRAGAETLGAAKATVERIEAAGGELRVDFECPDDVGDLEIRVWTPGGFRGSVDRVRLSNNADDLLPSGFSLVLTPSDPRLHGHPEQIAGHRLRIVPNDDGCILHGPGASIPPGRYCVEVVLGGVKTGTGIVRVEAYRIATGEVLSFARGGVDKISANGGVLRTVFHCPDGADDLEIRVCAYGGFQGTVEGLRLSNAAADIAIGSAHTPYIFRGYRMGPVRYDLWIVDQLADDWYGEGRLDFAEARWCLDQIKPGMTIADCGAHHGNFTVAFAHATGMSGKVLAWEALPSNAAVIARNIALNECANALVRAKALGDHPGRLKLWSGASNTVVQWGKTETTHDLIDVDIVRLDDELRGRLDFIKLDVEGSDLQALIGAERAMAARPILNLELHNFIFEDRLDTVRRIFERLAPLRYRYAVIPRIEDEIVDLGTAVDVERMAAWDNPHVLCVPE